MGGLLNLGMGVCGGGATFVHSYTIRSWHGTQAQKLLPRGAQETNNPSGISTSLKSLLEWSMLTQSAVTGHALHNGDFSEDLETGRSVISWDPAAHDGRVGHSVWSTTTRRNDNKKQQKNPPKVLWHFSELVGLAQLDSAAITWNHILQTCYVEIQNLRLVFLILLTNKIK